MRTISWLLCISFALPAATFGQVAVIDSTGTLITVVNGNETATFRVTAIADHRTVVPTDPGVPGPIPSPPGSVPADWPDRVKSLTRSAVTPSQMSDGTAFGIAMMYEKIADFAADDANFVDGSGQFDAAKMAKATAVAVKSITDLLSTGTQWTNWGASLGVTISGLRLSPTDRVSHIKAWRGVAAGVRLAAEPNPISESLDIAVLLKIFELVFSLLKTLKEMGLI